MRYFEAPQEYSESGPAVFLAGGISDAEDWQAVVAARLERSEGTVLNPRRKHFEPTVENHRSQIAWEFRHLERATLVAFWFPPQTLCPIALFELGACCSSHEHLVVAAHPDYGRRFDLQVQLSLRRPEIHVVDSLEELVQQIEQHPAFQGASR